LLVPSIVRSRDGRIPPLSFNPMKRRFVRLDRAPLILSIAAAMWAVAVALTGGFVLEAGALRVSSHSP
jgi:hypothetical protein